MSFVVFYLIIYSDFILFGLHSLYYNLYFSRYFHLIGYFPCCVSWFSFTLHKECLYSSCDLVLLVLKSLFVALFSLSFIPFAPNLFLFSMYLLFSKHLTVYIYQLFVNLLCAPCPSDVSLHSFICILVSKLAFFLELRQLCTPMPFVVFFLIRPHSLETNS